MTSSRYTAFRYTTRQVAVHWLAAAAEIFLLLTGTFVLEALPSLDGAQLVLATHDDHSTSLLAPWESRVLRLAH